MLMLQVSCACACACARVFVCSCVPRIKPLKDGEISIRYTYTEQSNSESGRPHFAHDFLDLL